MRARGEKIERGFAHCYEAGGMRRLHLRGHPNILKRLLVHVAGFNLGLTMRQLVGVSRPRVLQGGFATLVTRYFTSWRLWRLPKGFRQAIRFRLRRLRASNTSARSRIGKPACVDLVAVSTLSPHPARDALVVRWRISRCFGCTFFVKSATESAEIATTN